MDQKILVKALNGLTLVVFLPMALSILTISSRARICLKKSSNMLVRCQVDPEVAVLISALEAAEDHRYRTHWGIDPIAVVRALICTFFKGHLQGASTIEQQYVRTCTGNIEISLSRKLEEAAVAVVIAILNDKDDVAYSYLSCAYFGEGVRGYDKAIEVILPGEFGEASSPFGAAAIVSLLKRPRPVSEHAHWRDAHRNRVNYIVSRQFMACANNSLQA